MSFELSLIKLVSLLNIYQKLITPNSDPISLLEYLSRGENAAGDFMYDMGDGIFPTTFDMDDFHKYIVIMEWQILEKDGSYDPNDKSFPPPVPISKQLLSNLHLGKGLTVKCTHTKCKGIEHCLMCVLLNKLCHNFHKLSIGDNVDKFCGCMCWRIVRVPQGAVDGLVPMWSQGRGLPLGNRV
jgi:hypothetical protein